MLFLKQSTAATVLIGPVLDSTGGLVTSGLVIGDLRIAKNGTIATMSGNTLAHSHAGHWTIALGTGDTDTTGRLTISVGNTSYAMAFRDYTVLLPGSFGWLIENAPNTTGGLATATGTISAFAGAISTFAGGAVSSVTGNVGGNVLGNVQGSVASVTNRVTANTDQLAGQTVTAAAGVTFPASVASPTNITSASGVVLASTTHTGAVIPTVSTVTNGVTVSDKTGFKLASDGLVSVTSWTVAITGNITGNYFIGNGSQLTGIVSNYGNANVVANLAALGTNPVSTTGNITGGNILTGGLISSTGTITGSSHLGTVVSASGNITGGNLLTGGLISATANITGGNVLTAGIMSSTGNATHGNILTGGLISATGNVTAQNFIGNISITGNVTGTSANVSLVAGAYTYTFDNVGQLTMPTVGGDEGGQINLNVGTTNTTITGPVTVDIFRDKVRFFEGSANSKGLYIDLSDCPTSVGGEITYKSSGYVNSGVFVQLDNIKAQFTSSGNRGLSIAAVSTTFTAQYSGNYNNSGGAGGSSSNGSVNITTTPTTSLFGWNFAGAGDGITMLVNDNTNSKTYRITVMVGAGFSNNFISIERL